MQKKALAVGAGIAALAAAATGVYMLTGKNAKNRKKVAKWAGDMQKDVVKELGKAKKVTKTTYNKVVDGAAKNYRGLKNVSAAELAAVAAELKAGWDNISADVAATSKAVRRVVPKVAKKVARRVAKKTVKKAVKKSARRRR